MLLAGRRFALEAGQARIGWGARHGAQLRSLARRGRRVAVGMLRKLGNGHAVGGTW